MAYVNGPLVRHPSKASSCVTGETFALSAICVSILVPIITSYSQSHTMINRLHTSVVDLGSPPAEVLLSIVRVRAGSAQEMDVIR